MRLFGILLVLTGTALAVSAQTNAPQTQTNANAPQIRRLSLEDCIQVALQHNLSVQIIRYNPEISRFTLFGAYGSYDPTFNIAGEHDFNSSPGGFDNLGRPFSSTVQDINSFNTSFQGLLPWGTTYNFGARASDTYGNQGTNFFESVNGSVGFFQLRQPLLRNFWIDSTRLAIQLDKRNLKISELDVLATVINTITSVEQAYYDLIFAQESIRVQQKALELAEQLLAENRKRVEVGALAPLDEKQAESQAAGSRTDLFSAQGAEDRQQRVLKGLLSDDYSKWANVRIQPDEQMVALPEGFDLQESWRKGISLRPDLMQQKLALEKQGYIVKFQKNQLFPQLDLVGNAGYNASSRLNFDNALDQIANRDNPFWGIGGQFSIPLSNRGPRNSYRAAKATKEQLVYQLRQLQQTILIQIEDAINDARTSYQQVGSTREARVFAQAALEAEQKKLGSGKSTSFQVLRLQRDLTSARSAEIRALANYNIALAVIAQREGSTLERRHVKLEVK